MKKKYIVLSGMILLALVFLIGIGIAQLNGTHNVCPCDPTILAGDRRCCAPSPTPTPLETSTIYGGDIEPYNGIIGPGNIFYGLKKTFEDLDELFTLNASDKLKKQIAHARQRIAEARTELERNNTEAANRALDGYLEKTKAINSTVSGLTWNETGLLSNASDMILYHRDVLYRLLDSHPDNMMLRRAYNSSGELYERFWEKTGQMARERVRFEEEKKKIEARIFGNVSQVEVSIVFTINNSKNTTISREILRRVNLSRDDVSRLLEIKEGEGGETFQESVGEDFSLGINITVVRVYGNFSLNATNRDEIIEGIYQKLSENPFPIVPSRTDWLEQETDMKW
jgi:hypothetical protein